MTPAPRTPRAVLWDLDGTLYHQRPLRRRMLLELACAPLLEGWGARRTVRRLKTFRRMREDLRGLGRPVEPLAQLQYSEPARVLGEAPEAVQGTVVEWMHRRPLRHLAGCLRRGLPALLSDLGARGLRQGVFSDYPAREKLDALGVAGAFSLTLCATDPEINAFKPHPRGFERACELWELTPREVLYVGDRPELDAAGALAAGMHVCILGVDGTDLEGVRRAALA